jgi:hypothetical protein
VDQILAEEKHHMRIQMNQQVEQMVAPLYNTLDMAVAVAVYRLV